MSSNNLLHLIRKEPLTAPTAKKVKRTFSSIQLTHIAEADELNFNTHMEKVEAQLKTHRYNHQQVAL